ncbi:MAG: type II secretion system protein [Verrucomicrobiota bacterium]
MILCPLFGRKKTAGFTLIELLVVIVILGLLIALSTGAVIRLQKSASTAIAAAALTQLSSASQLYLAENQNTFWKYREFISGEGYIWWFGFESFQSIGSAEGTRDLDKSRGPLGPYLADSGSLKTDPAFTAHGATFKPKYGDTHFGYGYNNTLEGKNALTLDRPGQVVVFATSAQVNTFQSPASASNPMIEEFYLINERETTVHFRVGGKAMVVFADGNVGLLPMEPTTLDARMPEAKIGRFAPVGDRKYME